MRTRWLSGFAAAALLSFLAIVGRSASSLAAPDTTATYAAVIRWYPRGSPPDLQVRVPPPGYARARSAFAVKVTQDGSPWFVTGPDGQSMISYPVNFSFHNGYRALPDLMIPADYTS